MQRDRAAVGNGALRVARGMKGKPTRKPRFKVEPHSLGFKPGIDTDRLNQLLDELETDEYARRSDR